MVVHLKNSDDILIEIIASVYVLSIFMAVVIRVVLDFI